MPRTDHLRERCLLWDVSRPAPHESASRRQNARRDGVALLPRPLSTRPLFLRPACTSNIALRESEQYCRTSGSETVDARRSKRRPSGSLCFRSEAASVISSDSEAACGGGKVNALLSRSSLQAKVNASQRTLLSRPSKSDECPAQRSCPSVRHQPP